MCIVMIAGIALQAVVLVVVGLWIDQKLDTDTGRGR